MGISVVINTYNADLHLDKVLSAVQDFDEILLCDMNSTDKTIQIAQKHNCRIIYHEHTGIVEPARNKTIQAASQEWVLIIDADEIVTPQLKEYLYQQINLPILQMPSGSPEKTILWGNSCVRPILIIYCASPEKKR